MLLSPQVCRIGTHLFHFAEYVNALRGWGRGLRNAVGRWYLDQEADKLAYQVVKYQQRDSWSHGDLLRLAHPKAPSAEHEAVFRWILSGAEGLGERTVKRKVNGENRVANYAPAGKLPQIVEAFEQGRDRWFDQRLRPATRGDPDPLAERGRGLGCTAAAHADHRPGA